MALAEPRAPDGSRQLLGFPIHANAGLELEGINGNRVAVIGA